MVADAASPTTKSLRTMQLREKVEAARLKAGTATKVGRPVDELEQRPPTKRAKPESGFNAKSESKDMRLTSPEQKTQTEIVREFDEPQGHLVRRLSVDEALEQLDFINKKGTFLP